MAQTGQSVPQATGAAAPQSISCACILDTKLSLLAVCRSPSKPYPSVGTLTRRLEGYSAFRRAPDTHLKIQRSKSNDHGEISRDRAWSRQIRGHTRHDLKNLLSPHTSFFCRLHSREPHQNG